MWASGKWCSPMPICWRWRSLTSRARPRSRKRSGAVEVLETGRQAARSHGAGTVAGTGPQTRVNGGGEYVPARRRIVADASLVEADAAVESLVERDDVDPNAPALKHYEHRYHDFKKGKRRRKLANQTHVSASDPDATLVSRPGRRQKSAVIKPTSAPMRTVV